MFKGEIKLSKILSHNFDKGSDRLYQPLRVAIQTLSTAPNQPKRSIQTSSLQGSQMQHNAFNISKDQQNLIAQSTFIPVNKKLVQTNNPQKFQKARSNSYRTLSVEQRVGSPIGHQMFQQSISNAGKKFQIVYDYDAFNNQRIKEPAKAHFATLTPSTMPRTRSATYVGVSTQSLANRVERAQTKIMNIQRKKSNTSIHFNIEQQQKLEKARRNNQQMGQYYEDCKKYVFNNQPNMKFSNTNLSNSNSQSKMMMMMKRSNLLQSQYKYNLFNILDRPINTQCQSGLCHKNAIIAPKIKKRW